eukprot:TRINITY_DN2627_c0_g1_i7.p1 TRINITY_DN2627_c0_g1~~TRINITY_DN2627_c0_g1_i7.p1  ORF type:complete len:663 (+),score=132.77 TRINITY_DN2627_c0_g1_i7:1417-3405(+)
MTPSTVPSISPTIAPSDSPTSSPTGSPTSNSLSNASFRLLNSLTGSVISELDSGGNVDLSSNPFVTIEVVTTSSVGSVQFILSYSTKTSMFRGLASTETFVDNSSPFVATAATGSIGYEPLNLSVGQYNLETTAFSGSDASGDVTGIVSLSFSVSDGANSTSSSTSVQSLSTAKVVGVVSSTFVSSISFAAVGVVSVIASLGNHETSVTSIISRLYINLFQYMQFLGMLSLMVGNAPEYYRNFYSGFTWTLGLVKFGLWEAVFGSWYSCSGITQEEKNASAFFTVMDELGLTQCQVFLTSFGMYVLINVVIVVFFCLILAVCIVYHRVKDFELIRFSTLKIWYLKTFFKFTMLGWSALLLTAAFQISLTSSAGIGPYVLAWVTVFVICGGVLTIGAVKLFPLSNFAPQNFDKTMETYGPFCDEFIVPAFRMFFVVILLRRAIEGIAVGTLRSDAVAQYSVLLGALFVLLCLVVFLRPYLHKLEFFVMSFVTTVQSTPSTAPSNTPTAIPSSQPSVAPSAVPSGSPSAVPSSVAPSAVPSSSPSTAPSDAPTAIPSSSPSVVPSNSPSTAPSDTPTSVPSSSPSVSPSAVPSGPPSNVPSTVAPSAVPSCSDKFVSVLRFYFCFLPSSRRVCLSLLLSVGNGFVCILRIDSRQDHSNGVRFQV